MSDMTDYNGSDNLDSRRAELEKLLDEANIPSLPQVACKLIQLCKEPNANFADFARVIESDIGLSSRLLRVVNSAFYGLRTKATNIERAINALGLKYVRSICLGFHLVDTLSRLAPAGFDMNLFWQESLLRAVIARQDCLQELSRTARRSVSGRLVAELRHSGSLSGLRARLCRDLVKSPQFAGDLAYSGAGNISIDTSGGVREPLPTLESARFAGIADSQSSSAPARNNLVLMKRLNFRR